LDLFLSFSSASSWLSSPRLGHYAAANAFLDALAHHRRAQGLPALSVNWGAWAEVGMAARHLQAGHSALHGTGSFTPKGGLEVLWQLIGQDNAEVGFMPIDWRQWTLSYPIAAKSPLLEHLVREQSSQARPSLEKSRFNRQELAVANAEQRRQLIESYLR